MASIIRDIEIDAPAPAVWDAIADFGAVHRRFAPGFVSNVELVPGGRLVTFADGLTVKELFLGRDDERRRLAYSVQSERMSHHSASFEVVEAPGGKARLVWTADVLPDEIAGWLAGRMEEGLKVAAPVVGRVRA
ncbi:SRPBCC family protein [Phenylobacterium sp.]|uniref:SRPBCC family protein n=1 Tax=Phenylobacterium sp. TaxID=1871053 RepID=UPI0026216071|nr:SRPBCC family protein [Phenylobacterium sp.]